MKSGRCVQEWGLERGILNAVSMLKKSGGGGGRSSSRSRSSSSGGGSSRSGIVLRNESCHAVTVTCDHGKTVKTQPNISAKLALIETEDPLAASTGECFRHRGTATQFYEPNTCGCFGL